LSSVRIGLQACLPLDGFQTYSGCVRQAGLSAVQTQLRLIQYVFVRQALRRAPGNPIIQ